MTMHPIQDIRAMLLQFERSSLKDLFFRSGDWAMFLAREEGGPNPLLGAVPEAEQAAATISIAAARAPHLGLFEPCGKIGDTVSRGDVLALVDVLGRKTEVLSPVDGRIAAILPQAQALVEFGDQLIEVEAA